MNKQIFVKTVEKLSDGTMSISYTDHEGKARTQKVGVCCQGEVYVGFDDTKFLIVTFETMEQ
jgi:hypothetical protein